MSHDRIVVTGLGATTPLGGDVSSSWQGLLAGKSGVRYLDEEWATDFPVRIAATAAVDPVTFIDRVQARRLDRVQQFAVVAAREAWADSGLASGDFDPERLSVAIGSASGGIGTILVGQDTLETRGPRAVSPMAVTMLMPNGSAAAVGLELGAKGGIFAPVSACVSGTEAISLALDLLRLGRADVVVAGGAEAAVVPLSIAGFAAMRALSTRNDEPGAASRPFDKGRDGFVMGEGAGVLILERESSAIARGAKIYAELAGSALTSDAYHAVAPDPTGAGGGRALSAALANAQVNANEVIHVNAHATSTPAGDVAEAAALRLALGDHTDLVPVSATKAATGHMLGAAGAVEAVFTVLALQDRLAPPTRNLDDQDDLVDLDVVKIEPRPLPAGGASVSTSFGFGGHNGALVFRSATG